MNEQVTPQYHRDALAKREYNNARLRAAGLLLYQEFAGHADLKPKTQRAKKTASPRGPPRRSSRLAPLDKKILTESGSDTSGRTLSYSYNPSMSEPEELDTLSDEIGLEDTGPDYQQDWLKQLQGHTATKGRPWLERAARDLARKEIKPADISSYPADRVKDLVEGLQASLELSVGATAAMWALVAVLQKGK